MTASNTRYFYNARAALHQMLEHGFHFPGYTEQDIRMLIDAGDENILLETDSGPLLKARKGDYIWLPDVLGFSVVDEVKKVFDNGNILTVSYKRSTAPGKQIILRDGKPFFWPESEQPQVSA